MATTPSSRISSLELGKIDNLRKHASTTMLGSEQTINTKQG
jgi:hypothetical protein